MRTRAFGVGVAFTLLALGMAGCDAMNDTVAPERNAAAERGDRGGEGPPFGGQDDGTATVYVVHGINGEDIGAAESLPVDIAVNEACVLEDVEFRDIQGPLSLEEGSYDLAVHLANGEPCSGTVAASASGVELSADDNVSVAAHLSDGGEPTLTPFANDVSAKPGKTRISARHAANFGAVDVVLDGTKPFTGVTNGQQGGAFLRPGSHTVALTPEGTMDRVFELTSDFEPFTLYAAYAVGTPGDGTFEVLLQTIEVGPEAEGDDEDLEGDDDEGGEGPPGR